jgi:hypothetical protein
VPTTMFLGFAGAMATEGSQGPNPIPGAATWMFLGVRCAMVGNAAPHISAMVKSFLML